MGNLSKINGACGCSNKVRQNLPPGAKNGWLAAGAIGDKVKRGAPHTSTACKPQSQNMTQTVDLSRLLDFDAHIELFPLIKALREKKNIVVIAGAGITASAESM